MTPSDNAIRAALLALAQARGVGKSFCPSEAARDLSDDWRALMPAIRAVASDLQSEGLLVATQRGRTVHPEHARGPIRLALASGPERPLP
ncbi:MAG: DUF3253 domain-containing protein [Alphaproteobacteria bacterium]|nr:DUF3253 domain-containing protein [Alphaproteobacteria bacterium]